MKNIGVTLKALRLERGYTLRQLAEKAQMPFSHLSYIENGKTIPTLDVIDRICFALDTPVLEVIVKTELEKKLGANQQKLFKDLQPYFRKLNAVAKQIYGPDSDSSDWRDDEDNSTTNRNPKIRGGGAKKVDNLN